MPNVKACGLTTAHADADSATRRSATTRPTRPRSELSLPQSAGLAAVTPAGILRAARTQAGSSAVSVDGYHAERMSFILRVYVPDPASFRTG